MADEPIGSLGGRTPLQAACKPSIDRVAALGRSGMLATVPAGFAPGSEIANLSVLGYDLPKVFEGRGSLEAASMGVRIEDVILLTETGCRNLTKAPKELLIL